MRVANHPGGPEEGCAGWRKGWERCGPRPGGQRGVWGEGAAGTERGGVGRGAPQLPGCRGEEGVGWDSQPN